MKHWGRKVVWSAAVLCVGAVSLVAASKITHAKDSDDTVQVSPYELVSNLDLSCHRVEGGITPVQSLKIGHLNPVLREMGFGEQEAYLGRLEQLCVPVAKNRNIPPLPVLDILRWIDLACYEARSEETKYVELKLEHLNPVLREMGVPPQGVVMLDLRQVCVPVAKNRVVPPDDVRRIVENVDIACYDVKPWEWSPEFPLHLTHLNPVLRRMGITEQDVGVIFPEQLCVPVMKNGNMPPEEVLKLVEWIDFLKYETVSESNPMVVPLELTHLNPLFRDSRPFSIRMLEIDQLAVPVAKNGYYPPSR